MVEKRWRAIDWLILADIGWMSTTVIVGSNSRIFRTMSRPTAVGSDDVRTTCHWALMVGR